MLNDIRCRKLLIQLRSGFSRVSLFPNKFAFVQYIFCLQNFYINDQLVPIILQNMKFYSSSKFEPSKKFEPSTLPTILDNSDTFHHELSKSYLPSQVSKVSQLESIYNVCVSQKNGLSVRKQYLEKLLQEKLSILKNIFQEENSQTYQQKCQQNSQSQKNMEVVLINSSQQKRFQQHKYQLMDQKKTERKYYTAINTPKPQYTQNPYTLYNTRLYSVQTEEEKNKTSAFNTIQPKKLQVNQKWYKTANITKQKLKQISNVQNKYQTIDQIWNSPASLSHHRRQSSFLQTYL